MGIFERIWQPSVEQLQRFGQWQVLGDVAGLVAVNKRQARLGLNADQTRHYPLQVQFVTTVFGQHQLHQRALQQADL